MLFLIYNFIYVHKQASIDTAEIWKRSFFVIPERYILLGTIFINPQNRTFYLSRPYSMLSQNNHVSFPAEDKGYSLS